MASVSFSVKTPVYIDFLKIILICERYLSKRRSVWKVKTGGPRRDSMWNYKNNVSFFC